MEFNSPMSKKLDELYRKIKVVEESLEIVKLAVQKLQAEEKKEIFKNVPGIEGTFDGIYMIMDDGQKREVPLNYAAKSKLVYGDKLKIVNENGKDMFKQVEKVERKEMHGVLSKKEGGWYVLTDAGSYKVSDIAAEFQKAEINDEAIVLLPASNISVPYATIDELLKNQDSKSDLTSQSSKQQQVKAINELVLQPESKKAAPNVSKQTNQSKMQQKPSGDSKNYSNEQKKESIDSVSAPVKQEKPQVQSGVKTIRHLDDDDLM